MQDAFTTRGMVLGQGRIGRLPFFLVKISLAVLLFGWFSLTGETDPVTGQAEPTTATLAGFGLFMWFGLMNVRRRVHDISRASILTYVAVFIPGIGMIVMLWLLFEKGDAFTNEHGDPPGATGYLAPPDDATDVPPTDPAPPAPGALAHR